MIHNLYNLFDIYYLYRTVPHRLINRISIPMKNSSGLSGIALVLMSLCICLGCSNEVDLHGDGEAIPIVYCLLNPLEQYQYVRVGKSFTRSLDQIARELIQIQYHGQMKLRFMLSIGIMIIR